MKQGTLLIACLAGPLALPSRAELVAHYKFDEDEASAIAMDEMGGADGLVGMFVNTGLPGVSGNAYEFGGVFSTQEDIVDMGNAPFFPAIIASGQMSFSAWINTTDTAGNRNTVVFAGNDTSSNVYSDLGVGAGLAAPNAGAATARNRPAGGPPVAQQTGIYSTPAVEPVNDGAWHHLVMTVDLSTATLALYVDGVLANSQTMGVPAFPTFNNFEIGRLGRSSPVDPFEGLIDDVQIYSRALTLDEVRYLHANPGLGVSRPAAPATITSAFIDGADFRIAFTGAPAATYQIRGSLDLETFAIDEGTATTDAAGEGTAAVPLVPGRLRQFYRIEEVPAP
jgi:hypothetical protein